MDYEKDGNRKSSGVAKAGLITGIVGASGVAANLLKHGGLFTDHYNHDHRHDGYRHDYGHGYGYGYEHGCHPHYPAILEPQKDCIATEKDICYMKELNCKEDEIIKLKSERYTDHAIDKKVSGIYGVLQQQEKQLDRLENKLIRLTDEVKCFENEEKRDIKDVYNYCDCTFVPQEKGYLDGRHINYHGVHPFLGVNCKDERFRDDDRKDRRRFDNDECCEEF